MRLFSLLLLTATPTLAASPQEVTEHYADLALATYEDSLTTATALQQAVAALTASPSDATLQAARDAWKAARVPYQQSEAFRFGNPIVDDWEGRVNSWPLEQRGKPARHPECHRHAQVHPVGHRDRRQRHHS